MTEPQRQNLPAPKYSQRKHVSGQQFVNGQIKSNDRTDFPHRIKIQHYLLH